MGHLNDADQWVEDEEEAAAAADKKSKQAFTRVSHLRANGRDKAFELEFLLSLGCSGRDMAKFLGITPNSVYKRLKARQRVRDRMHKQLYKFTLQDLIDDQPCNYEDD